MNSDLTETPAGTGQRTVSSPPGETGPATTAAAVPTPHGGSLSLKQILVPVDFSGPSRKALEYAIAFARQFQAQLQLVHVVEVSYLGTGLGEIEAPLLETELRQSAVQQLARLVATHLHDVVTHQTRVLVGQPWHEVCEAAKSLEVDLIIMGTHGYTGFKHVVLGSTAERVIRHAPCPVLVVREREREFVQAQPPRDEKCEP